MCWNNQRKRHHTGLTMLGPCGWWLHWVHQNDALFLGCILLSKWVRESAFRWRKKGGIHGILTAVKDLTDCGLWCKGLCGFVSAGGVRILDQLSKIPDKQGFKSVCRISTKFWRRARSNLTKVDPSRRLSGTNVCRTPALPTSEYYHDQARPGQCCILMLSLLGKNIQC